MQLQLRIIIVAAAMGATLSGCPRRPAVTPDGPAAREGGGDGSHEEGQQRSAASRRPPAGSTCSGRSDCASDQLCVDSRCQYRTTSVAGEVYAAAAQAQAEAGDWAGAIESYDHAFDAFQHHEAPVPPDIAC